MKMLHLGLLVGKHCMKHKGASEKKRDMKTFGMVSYNINCVFTTMVRRCRAAFCISRLGGRWRIITTDS